MAHSLNDLTSPSPLSPPPLTHCVPATLASSLFLQAHFSFWGFAQAVPSTLEHFSTRNAHDSFTQTPFLKCDLLRETLPDPSLSPAPHLQLNPSLTPSLLPGILFLLTTLSHPLECQPLEGKGLCLLTAACLVSRTRKGWYKLAIL